MLKIYNEKKIWALFLLVSLAGGFLFFPVRIADEYTCLFHRLFNYDDPVKMKEHIHNAAIQVGQHEDLAMLSFYLHRYALIWWANIALAVLSVYSIRKIKNKLTYLHTKENGGIL
ncbi:MAG TPA: hypothetical protein EYP36_01000 [Calditrichaeota bacterium]|nr:hypothetical protein [Calditrichota bacterium]